MANKEFPIACSLTDSQLQERRNTVLRQISGHMLEVKELESGYAYRLLADEQMLMEIVQMVMLERSCCPFLSFTVRVEAGDDFAWLELTGPEGTKSFLATMFEVNRSSARG